jgi:hypothetical protein
MFCRSLFVLLYFFFWPLCCLFFFDIRILINPLISSNSFYLKNALSKFFFCQNVLENGGKQTHNVHNSKCFWWSGKFVIFRRKEDANFFSNTICTIVLFCDKNCLQYYYSKETKYYTRGTNIREFLGSCNTQI